MCAYARGDDGAIVVVAAGSADLATGEPVTPESRFFIGSISKNLYATVALRLVQAGQLDLDDPVGNNVAWAEGERITVRMTLGEVLRSASGMSIAQQLQTQVCKLLGLVDTYLYGEEHPEAPATRLEWKPCLIPYG